MAIGQLIDGGQSTVRCPSYDNFSLCKITKRQAFLQAFIHLYGVMRRATGKVILSAEYEAVYMASPTLLGAQLEGTDSYVLYDMQGRRVDCEIK